MPEPDPAAADAADVTSLLRFLDAAPSPFHAVAEAAARLEAHGFAAVDEREPWPATGRGFVVRGGSLVAWAIDHPDQLAGGFQIVGAHTDSPNLRVKPRPDTGRAGFQQLAVEVYGGALLNSWLDRDLGLSGRIGLTGEAGATRLVRTDEPLLRVPQLAIHLDRGVNENGLVLNPQQHLAPVWGVGAPVAGDFVAFLAELAGVAPGDVASWDVMLHDRTPATLLGREGALLSSGRLDNLLSCWAGITALAAAGAAPGPGVPVVCLFDHEEVGSESASGAAGALLPTVLERIALAAGADRAAYLQALAASRCVSADGAHATHPNYPERHEPGHLVAIDGGPVLKRNANVRYATDAASSAWFLDVAARAGVPTQEFVVRSDLPCGSTIGPITAARLGISTVDVGVAQLSMHSARELCGAEDPVRFTRVLTAFLAT